MTEFEPKMLPTRDEYHDADEPNEGSDDPELAAIFAMMEEGGEDLLTEEEAAQLQELIPDINNDFNRNLALDMDESDLAIIASEAIERFNWDEDSRKEWFSREAEGIRLLGVSDNVEGGADFEGASTVVHPVILEAILQFHARALAELWPPDGPAKTMVMGAITREKDEQAKRVGDYINYAYTLQMKDAFNTTDQMLFRLPLSGSIFIKLYYCPIRQCIVRKLIQPGDFLVPYHCDSLMDAPRTTHVLRLTHNDGRKMQISGFYRDVPLVFPMNEDAQTDDTLRNEIDAVDSKTRMTYDDKSQRHVILEQTMYRKLPGFDDPKGLESPYVVHVDKEQTKVLAVYRNWKEGDPRREALRYVTHYKFLPGLGFYGFGLLHIMGGIGRAATGAMRALLDAAQFANMPGGFRSRDARIRQKDVIVRPGEWKEVEASPEELKNAFFTLPYKEPSQVLLSLLGMLDSLGRRIGGSIEVLVGDSKNTGPVGTTLALIEQGLKVMSGIHMRLHRSMQEELALFQDLCEEYVPQEGYPYDVPGESRMVMAQDFNDHVSVIPVSDPNIISATHRIALAQAVKDLATQSPDMYNRRAVDERMLQAIRVQNYDEVLLPIPQAPRTDPITEGANLMTGKPVQAFPDQDHEAHIIVHLDQMERVPLYIGAQGNKMRNKIQTAFMAHISEHKALQTTLMYQMALQQQMGEMPQLGQPLPPEMENMIASLAAQAAQMMQPQKVDPQEVEAARRAAIDEERAKGEIRRKDAVVAAQIDRANAETAADINRRAALHEAELLHKYISPEAQKALEQEPSVPSPMGERNG